MRSRQLGPTRRKAQQSKQQAVSNKKSPRAPLIEKYCLLTVQREPQRAAALGTEGGPGRGPVKC